MRLGTSRCRCFGLALALGRGCIVLVFFVVLFVVVLFVVADCLLLPATCLGLGSLGRSGCLGAALLGCRRLLGRSGATQSQSVLFIGLVLVLASLACTCASLATSGSTPLRQFGDLLTLGVFADGLENSLELLDDGLALCCCARGGGFGGLFGLADSSCDEVEGFLIVEGVLEALYVFKKSAR